ncbi:MAG: hypothetical protein AAGI70_08175 [Pseudomonadota bacterium]
MWLLIIIGFGSDNIVIPEQIPAFASKRECETARNVVLNPRSGDIGRPDTPNLDVGYRAFCVESTVNQ